MAIVMEGSSNVSPGTELAEQRSGEENRTRFISCVQTLTDVVETAGDDRERQTALVCRKLLLDQLDGGITDDAPQLELIAAE